MIENSAVITKRHFEDTMNHVNAILDKLPSKLSYHCKEHTEQVVKSVHDIAKEMELPDSLIWSMQEEAAFHDTGFIKRYLDNEVLSADMSEKYKRESANPYTEEHIKRGRNAILKTEITQIPKTIFEEILRDADLSNLGQKTFPKWADRLRDESRTHEESSLHEVAKNDIDWLRLEVRFLNNTMWFTKGANGLYQAQKEKNSKDLKKQLAQKIDNKIKIF